MARPSTTSLETKTLSTLDKPILVSVCKTSQFEYKRAFNFGYATSTPFIQGLTTNSSVVSWTGLQANMTFNETLAYLYNSGLENIRSIGESTTNRFLIPYGLCKVYQGNPEKRIRLKIKSNGEKYEYFIFISDPSATVQFQMPNPLMTGDKIRIETHENITIQKNQDYYIELKETGIEIDDGSCAVYPNHNHNSYSDCVDEETRSKFLPMFGCIAPWISTKNQCVGLTPRLPEQEPVLQWVREVYKSSWGGFHYKSETCLLPCTLLSARSKFQHLTKVSHQSFNEISLHFDDQIKVKKIILAYDFVALLVEIGSSLGLWLGLSVVGVYDVLVQAIVQVKNKIICKPKNTA